MSNGGSLPAAAPPPVLVRASGALRFDQGESLGRGGMAEVHRALDTINDRAVAIKRLTPQLDALRQRRSAQLFEREFLALAQLAHPRIVEVYDYVVDAAGPFYSMELLDGGDLHELAPLPWQRACAIARDVCSALSLLHSRKLVHCDVTPRNVRCTQAGLAKLIDFGALATMGPSKMVVGTPPCCAPELVQKQALDARTDLYALGATLYFTLTGRHAYSARQFGHLAELWRETPVRPSAIVPGIPEALDLLVLDLLRLDPDARPASAAEVMQRLSAIDQQSVDESLLVAQSYLSTPQLVGRGKQLARARHKLKATALGRGSALLISGPTGVGRSRFLDACLLEAALAGATVVRVDADRAQQGDYGLVQTLGMALLELMPAAAFAAASGMVGVLAHAIPGILERVPGAALEQLPLEHRRPKLQRALQAWLIALSDREPLVIAVDDMHRVDEPSATLLALLALDVHGHKLTIMASSNTDCAPLAAAAHKVFGETASKVVLESLSKEDTARLLGSLFGEVPHLEGLSHRLHTIAFGNPRDLMRLAQRLVDEQIVCYRDGSWSVPAQIADTLLPANITEDYRARLTSLRAGAHELACALALCPDRSFTIDECATLLDRASGSLVLSEVDEVLRAEVARAMHDDLTLAHPAWGALLHETMSSERKAALHARLARVFEQRPDEAFRVAQHCLYAGALDEGLTHLVAHAKTSQEATAHGASLFYRYARALPANWFEVFDLGIKLCEERAQPRLDAFMLRSRLAGLTAVLGQPDPVHLPALVAELRAYSGLDDWAQLSALEPGPRLQQALERTQRRHVEASEHERVLDPLSAIRQLARALISISAMVVTQFDVPLLLALPSIAPLAALSPALASVDALMRGMRERLLGRGQHAHAVYTRLIERLEQPDHGGLDASHSRFALNGVQNGLGLLEASLGLPQCLARAEVLDSDPSHQANAVLVRMVYHLWQGDSREADSQRREAERVRIENSATPLLEGGSLLWETHAHAASDDLTRIKHVIGEIFGLARRYRGWFPVLHYGRAEYQRIRGDYALALQEARAGLALTKSAEHQLWTLLASSELRALFELDRCGEALPLAENYLAQAIEHELGVSTESLRMMLALIQAKLGQHAAAVVNAEQVIANYNALGVTGILLGLAHETRARVAIFARDEAAFDRHAELARQLFSAHKNPALIAKQEKLKHAAQRHALGGRAEPQPARPMAGFLDTTQGALMLRACRDPAQRARLALKLLAGQSGATTGFLFALSETGLECIAKLGVEDAPESILSMIRSYLVAESEGDSDTTGQSSAVRTSVWEWFDESGVCYRPVLLSHQTEGTLAITGVAVLAAPREADFRYPAQMAATLSRFTSDAGGHTILVTEA